MLGFPTGCLFGMKRLNPLLRRLRLTCGDLATRDGWQGILKLTYFTARLMSNAD
jgi:hypothetical protein